MCTSIIFNGNKTIIGWNFDNPGYPYKIVKKKDRVYISLSNGSFWTPVFGAHANGTFVTLPTCHPFNEKSNPPKGRNYKLMLLNLDLIQGRRTLDEVRNICENNPIYSAPDVTYQAQDTDKDGNVLQIVTGQGYRYIKKPRFSVMANFQTLHEEKEYHPWAGLDRYQTATKMLSEALDDFDYQDCFKILENVSQCIESCPTQVSMVFDVTDNIVYWCENRQWDTISKKSIHI